MTGMLRVPRSRGALNGGLLVLLGIWGGLIAFVGLYPLRIHARTRRSPTPPARLWLEILPAAGTIVGGLIPGGTASRPVAIFGAWLAALSGAWFVLGGPLSTLWHTGGSAGLPVGNNLHRVVEQIGFFTGLGLVIVFLAAVALGRFTVIGARERTLAEPPAAETVPVEDGACGGEDAAGGYARPRAGHRGHTTIPAASIAVHHPPDASVEETRSPAPPILATGHRLIPVGRPHQG